MSEDVKLHSGHRMRMYDNFIRAENLDDFSEIKIVEMVLYYGIDRIDTYSIAHKYIEAFGDAEKLFSALPMEVSKKTGCNKKAACIIALVGKYHEMIGFNEKIVFENDIAVEDIEKNLDIFYKTGNLENMSSGDILLMFLYFGNKSKSKIPAIAKDIRDKITKLQELFMMSAKDILELIAKCNKQTACVFALPFEIEKRFDLYADKKRNKIKNENLHSGHRMRMYDNFIRAENLDGFSEIEIVEMVLYYGRSRIDTNKFAHNYIEAFGNAKKLLSALPMEVLKKTGCNKKSACSIALLGKYCEITGFDGKIEFERDIAVEDIEKNFDIFYKTGSLENMNSGDILLMFLYLSNNSKSKIPIMAKDIKDKIPILRELFMMIGKDIFKLIEKCNKQTACIFALPFEIEKRFNLSGNEKKIILNSVEKAAKHLIPYFRDRTIEYFYIIYLDENNREIKTICLSKGNDKRTDVKVDILIENALKCKAKNVIISHNHPSGNLKLSVDDTKTTAAVIAALKTVQIKLFDHIIISGDNYYSFAKERIFGLG